MDTDERIRGAVEVRRAISTCNRCSLRPQASRPIPWSGPLSPDLAVLGEAPGHTEDQEGKPFIGVAGRYLRKCLDEAGFDSRKVTYLNSANCFPSRTRTPNKEELAACNVHLVGQLKAIQPKHLFIVGVTAFTATIGDRLKLSQVLGRPFFMERLGAWPRFVEPIVGCASYHPAARSATQRLRLKEDIQKFFHWIRKKETFPGDCVRCHKEVDHWDEWGFAWCRDHAGKQLELL